MQYLRVVIMVVILYDNTQLQGENTPLEAFFNKSRVCFWALG